MFLSTSLSWGKKKKKVCQVGNPFMRFIPHTDFDVALPVITFPFCSTLTVPSLQDIIASLLRKVNRFVSPSQFCSLDFCTTTERRAAIMPAFPWTCSCIFIYLFILSSWKCCPHTSAWDFQKEAWAPMFM